MKNGLKASVVMASMLLLAGCKNFWNVSSTTCTSNCSTTVSSGIFYVLNSSAGQVEIAGYSIVKNTLTALSGSPYSLPSGPYAVAVAPNDSFLYVSTQSGIYLYTIGSGGALTLASTTPISTDFAGYSMQVDATDSWLVEASGQVISTPSPSVHRPGRRPARCSRSRWRALRRGSWRFHRTIQRFLLP